MIQRKQTLWLLLAGIFAFVSLKASFFSGIRTNDITLKEVVFVTASYSMLLTVFTIATATVTLITIFLFKNRKLQIRFGILSLFLSISTLGLYYWQSKNFVTSQCSINLTAIIPISIPVLIILAIIGINKDEKLIKSIDRLR